MQVKNEMKTSSLAVHESVQRTLYGEGSKTDKAPRLGSSRPKRRNGKKKKNSEKCTPTVVKRENGNVEHPTLVAHQKEESGRDASRRGPIEGIKTLFQGSPRSRSTAEIESLPVIQPYKRPATPGPSRKNRDKRYEQFQESPGCNQVRHRPSTRVNSGLSSLHSQDQATTSGQNRLEKETSRAASSEKLDATPQRDAPKFVNQNQKKRRNRRKNKHEKSKRDSSPAAKFMVQCPPVQPDEPVADQSCHPTSNVMEKSIPQMANSPPSIPMLEFEVKSDHASSNLSSSVENLGRDMVPMIDRSPQKETGKNSPFPRAGRVVRILQNQNRVIDVGCTQVTNQHSQKSLAQALSAANQTRRITEQENQNSRPASFDETGRIRAEVSNPHESESAIGKQHRDECQGPSPGASSPTFRTRMSSQDVRNNNEGTTRIRRTPWKPRRKPFQK